MDYYTMRNLLADTQMRESIARESSSGRGREGMGMTETPEEPR